MRARPARQVCLWCYHHIKENLNGQCPACRRPYADAELTADPEELAKLAVEKKHKDKLEKRQQRSKETVEARPRPAPLTREQLQNVRVIQRTLVYAVGLSPRIAREEMLRRPEFFGQYGRIVKVAVNTAQAYSGNASFGQSLSCYITYSNKDEVRAGGRARARGRAGGARAAPLADGAHRGSGGGGGVRACVRAALGLAAPVGAAATPRLAAAAARAWHSRGIARPPTRATRRPLRPAARRRRR